MTGMEADPGQGGLELISSRRNPLVGRLRALHQGRGRREQQRLLLEGTHLLQEVLRLGLKPDCLLATAAWPDEIASAAASRCFFFRLPVSQVKGTIHTIEGD